MFRYALDGRVRWPVKMPGRDESGEINEMPVPFEFTLIHRDELREADAEAARSVTNKMTAMLRKGTASGADVDFDAVLKELTENDRSNEERIIKHTHGWDEKAMEFLGPDDKPVDFPFSEQNLRRLLGDQLIFNAVRLALFEVSRGAREKN